jgi:hypothetical protein
MITPVVQRQMFQTINTEAVRAAMEVGGLHQREAGLRQAVLDKVAEDQVSVPEIPVTEGMRTEERKGGRQNDGRKGSGHREQDQAEGEPPANPAETHMDFLA